MSRSERLLQLLQVLRRYRQPVSGDVLAKEIGVSLRTLYRDIASLQAQGAMIDGEPGVGYVLRPGHCLPPLMFTAEEIDALVLGARWVRDRGDTLLAGAARDALAKIEAVLPSTSRHAVQTHSLLIGPNDRHDLTHIDVAALRNAIRTERKLVIRYVKPDGVVSERSIWPFAMGYFNVITVLLAWCETRSAFRHFRVDRMETAEVLDERYPTSRSKLLKAWRIEQNIHRPLD